MYTLVYCYLLLYPLSPREALGLSSFYRIVIVYRIIDFFNRIIETFRYDIIVSLLNDNIEFFYTISNTKPESKTQTYNVQ